MVLQQVWGVCWGEGGGRMQVDVWAVQKLRVLLGQQDMLYVATRHAGAWHRTPHPHRLLLLGFATDWPCCAEPCPCCCWLSRWCVNETLRKCLTIEPPEPSAKLQVRETGGTGGGGGHTRIVGHVSGELWDM